MIADLWQALAAVNSVAFSAASKKGQKGWNGHGEGKVVVQRVNDQQQMFDETGLWTTSKGVQLNFSNTYRWSELAKNKIQLEHLRYGQHNPVSLLVLKYNPSGNWTSAQPHRCNKDLYKLDIQCQTDAIEMRWRIIGPRKNEEIIYVYR